MWTPTNPIVIGGATKKSDADVLFDNIVYLISKGATLTPTANTLTIDSTGNYYTVAAAAFNNIATSGGSIATGARTAAGIAREVTLEFEGAALITAAAALRLPGADASGTAYGSNITTYSGLVLRFREESANNWRCTGGVEICPRFETHKTGGNQNPTGNGTADLVTWDTPTVNTNGTWASNTYTVTIPGIYDIVGEFFSFLVSGDTMDALIYINGAAVCLDRRSTSISSIYVTQRAGITASLAVGDTVKIYAILSSSPTTQFIRGVEAINNQFTIVKRKMF